MDILALVLVLLGGAIYLLPAIIVANKDHRHWLAIQILNLLLGWTLLGWIVALVWSLMDQPTPKPSKPTPAAKAEEQTSAPPPSPSQYKKCPFCAEEIRLEAIKCKHCGSQLEE